MSTILDALKKSEQERKLNKLPTLSDLPVPEERSRWPALIIITLLLSLLMLVAWLGFKWLPDRLAAVDEMSNKAVVDKHSNEKDSGATSNSAEIVVNVVSYSERAEQRFVMINGKLYRQGEFIRAGLMVESIKPDSVVLIQRGRRIERRP